MRQRASTPKGSSSTFQAKAISDIVAPEPEFNLEVTDLAPAVTPTEAKGFSLRGDLDFSVFKMGILIPSSAGLGAKRGFFTVSLMWDNYNDLDLHCIGPNREEIFYKNRKRKFGNSMSIWSQGANALVNQWKIYISRTGSAEDTRYASIITPIKGVRTPPHLQCSSGWKAEKKCVSRAKSVPAQPKREIYAVNIR